MAETYACNVCETTKELIISIALSSVVFNGKIKFRQYDEIERELEPANASETGRKLF